MTAPEQTPTNTVTAWPTTQKSASPTETPFQELIRTTIADTATMTATLTPAPPLGVTSLRPAHIATVAEIQKSFSRLSIDTDVFMAIDGKESLYQHYELIFNPPDEYWLRLRHPGGALIRSRHGINKTLFIDGGTVHQTLGRAGFVDTARQLQIYLGLTAKPSNIDQYQEVASGLWIPCQWRSGGNRRSLRFHTVKVAVEPSPSGANP